MEKIDTVKLKENGKDILYLKNELNEEINALYTRISNISTNTLEWIGPSSNSFIQRCNLEKSQYNKLIDSLNKYGNYLVDVADEYEMEIRKLG